MRGRRICLSVCHSSPAAEPAHVPAWTHSVTIVCLQAFPGENRRDTRPKERLYERNSNVVTIVTYYFRVETLPDGCSFLSATKAVVFLVVYS